MKSLFNRYEAYNKVGGEVNDEIQRALDPIFKKWSDEGYKVNDIESIAIDNINVIGAIIRLEKSMATINCEKKLLRSLG